MGILRQFKIKKFTHYLVVTASCISVMSLLRAKPLFVSRGTFRLSLLSLNLLFHCKLPLVYPGFASDVISLLFLSTPNLTIPDYESLLLNQGGTLAWIMELGINFMYANFLNFRPLSVRKFPSHFFKPLRTDFI